MKKYIYIIGLFVGLIVAFASCEMKQDLTGGLKVPGQNSGDSTKIPNDQMGLLSLKLDPQKEVSAPGNTPATKATDDALDVKDFSIQILSEDGTVVRQYKSYADIDELLLPAGSYQVIAAKGELKDAAYDNPYYQGTQFFTIKPKEVAEVLTSCALSNKKISIKFSDDFLNRFEADYDIVMTNGLGVLTSYAGDAKTPYFKTTDNLDFILHATTKKGLDVSYHCDLFKDPTVKDYNNIVVELDVVPDTIPSIPDPNPKPDPDPDPDPNPGPDPDPGVKPDTLQRPVIKVDVRLIEQEYIIQIPSNFVPSGDGGGSGDGDGGDGGSGGGDGGGSTLSKPTIKGDGFDIDRDVISLTKANAASTKVVINIVLPTGVSAMKVTISSDNKDFMGAVADIGNPFDMLNLNSSQAALLSPVKKGDKSVKFDVSGFMGLLVNFEGTHKFKIDVDDANGTKNSKTLTIKAK